MKTHSPVAHTCRVGFAALACLALLAGCAAAPGSTDTPTETPTTAPDGGSNVGVPVTDYGTFVFDSSPFADPVIEGGIVPGDEFEERYYVTTITSADGTDRFNRTLLPSDAGEFVDNVSYVDASLVVIQAFPASSVPDYRVESVHRDGPTLVVSINDSSASGTTDVTVETVLLRVPGEDPDGVVVTTEEGDTFDTGVGYQRRRPSQGKSDASGCNSFTHQSLPSEDTDPVRLDSQSEFSRTYSHQYDDGADHDEHQRDCREGDPGLAGDRPGVGVAGQIEQDTQDTQQDAEHEQPVTVHLVVRGRLRDPVSIPPDHDVRVCPVSGHNTDPISLSIYKGRSGCP